MRNPPAAFAGDEKLGRACANTPALGWTTPERTGPTMGTLRLIPAGGKPAIVRRTVGATNPAAGDCRCELCGTQFIIPQAGEPRACGECRRRLAEAFPDAETEIRAMFAHINMLGDGTGPYAGLPEHERREQLDALGTALAGRRYNPTAGEDRQLKASIRRMSDQQLINYVAGAPADAAGYQAYAVCLVCEEIARRYERRDAAAWSEGQAGDLPTETDS